MGGHGADQFMLGDRDGAYYLDEADGFSSFASIRRFDSLDTIALSGSIGDYRISTDGDDTTLFRVGAGTDDAMAEGRSETIAVIENTVGLNLNSDQFSFV